MSPPVFRFLKSELSLSVCSLPNRGVLSGFFHSFFLFVLPRQVAPKNPRGLIHDANQTLMKLTRELREGGGS